MSGKKHVSHSDISSEIEKCAAMAAFLSMSVALIIEKHTDFTDRDSVSYGAQNCLDDLRDKLFSLIGNIKEMKP